MPVLKDLTGQKFNKLTVLEQAPHQGNRVRWHCRCDCGREVVVDSASLKSGHTQSCGCIAKNVFLDLTGQKFGELIVIERGPNDRHSKAAWRCLCSCGNERVVASGQLKSGNATTCGCASGNAFRDMRGQKFGKLMVESRMPNNRHNQPTWLCLCDCGVRVAFTSNRLRRRVNPSCGCAAKTVLKDLIGQRFGKLTVICWDSIAGAWLCGCDCGRERLAKSRQLTEGVTTSCRCAARTAFKDLTGLKFGALQVIKRMPYNDENNRVMWLCSCDCGNERAVSGGELNGGRVTSCGCTARTAFKDLIGQRFGKFTVLKRAPNDKHNKTAWVCSCDCGQLRTVTGNYLKSGFLSCGCGR